MGEKGTPGRCDGVGEMGTREGVIKVWVSRVPCRATVVSMRRVPLERCIYVFIF